jgi:2-phosphosulfolactate phosphatase
MKNLNVVVSPALLPYYEVKGKIVVVIDILRATSSMCVAFKTGVSKILTLGSSEECLIFKDFDFVVAAEKNAVKVPGFDLGNSPFEFENPILMGRKIALATTNGTKAIKYSLDNDAAQIVIGSFLNISILADWLKTANQDVILLCAGWKNKANIEDTLFAGALVNRLIDHFQIDCDSALMAQEIFDQNKDNLETLVRKSSHAKRFKLLNFETDDVSFCLQNDVAPVLPIYQNGYFINLNV